MAKQKASQKVFIGILAVMTAVTLAGAGGIFGGGVSPNSGAPAQELANQNQPDNIPTSNVPCLTSEDFHLHPHLTVLLDGEDVPIPANIGVSPDCIQELHTHESDGIIHVESDMDKGYTFADFLGLLGLPIDQAGFVTRLTVDGEFNDNDPNFLLEDGQEIVLEYITLPDFAAPQGDEFQETVPEAE